MANARLTVLGVYKVEPSGEAFQDALSVQGDEEYVRRELSSLVLVELKVEGADHRFELTNFKQPHTEYVPYDETFFDLEGGATIAPNRADLGYGVFDDPATKRTLKYTQATEKTTPATVEEVERYRLPGQRDFAVAFFLHFFDHARPLETPYGPLQLPPASELPERLRWKKYVYWD
jgi:hypothetical protein